MLGNYSPGCWFHREMNMSGVFYPAHIHFPDFSPRLKAWDGGL
jgi:hypothetical protein